MVRLGKRQKDFIQREQLGQLQRLAKVDDPFPLATKSTGSERADEAKRSPSKPSGSTKAQMILKKVVTEDGKASFVLGSATSQPVTSKKDDDTMNRKANDQTLNSEEWVTSTPVENTNSPQVTSNTQRKRVLASDPSDEVDRQAKRPKVHTSR